MRPWLLPLAFFALLPGCVTELLAPEDETHRNVACFVMDPEGRRDVQVVVHEATPARHSTAAVAALRSEIARVSERAPDQVQVAYEEATAPEWDRAALADWAEDQQAFSSGLVHLHVLWVHGLPEDAPAGRVIAPGAFVVDQEEIQEGAAGGDVDAVATAVLLHYAGHALGVVNHGIPVHDRDLAKREGPPQHDPDLSVLHESWHRAPRMDTNGTHDRYPDAIVEDWRAAHGPLGACT